MKSNRSSTDFDAGWENEAKRISVALRILLHDRGRNSQSLLGQLGYKDQMQFVDSGIRKQHIVNLLTIPENARVQIMPEHTGLVVPAIIGNETKFVAPLLRNRFKAQVCTAMGVVPTIGFEEWWTFPFIEASNQHVYSRYDIVMTMADQDGGGSRRFCD